mmetsp:Transcript_88588/g.286861  ORF Transcript_88588/g.286861 Transcript_88588/m.286861 type:complete len:211 (+) Transcript_88588:1075-1707(+)
MLEEPDKVAVHPLRHAARDCVDLGDEEARCRHQAASADGLVWELEGRLGNRRVGGPGVAELEAGILLQEPQLQAHLRDRREVGDRDGRGLQQGRRVHVQLQEPLVPGHATELCAGHDAEVREQPGPRLACRDALKELHARLKLLESIETQLASAGLEARGRRPDRRVPDVPQQGAQGHARHAGLVVVDADTLRLHKAESPPKLSGERLLV